MMQMFLSFHACDGIRPFFLSLAAIEPWICDHPQHMFPQLIVSFPRACPIMHTPILFLEFCTGRQLWQGVDFSSSSNPSALPSPLPHAAVPPIVVSFPYITAHTYSPPSSVAVFVRGYLPPEHLPVYVRAGRWHQTVLPSGIPLVWARELRPL